MVMKWTAKGPFSHFWQAGHIFCNLGELRGKCKGVAEGGGGQGRGWRGGRWYIAEACKCGDIKSRYRIVGWYT